MSRTIYISGPMTGIKDFNRKEFFKAQARLTAQGFVVLNPAVNPMGLTYAQYMQIDIAMLQVCDSIYLLKGYSKSKGAGAELALARSLGFKEYYEHEGHYIDASGDLLASVLVTDGEISDIVEVALAVN